MRAGFAVVLLFLHASITCAADRITILTDAFGRAPGLHRDWGYAALIEIAGKRILFDTGNDRKKFEENVRALNVDLRRLDFVVISHRHGDHTAGLPFLHRVNPRVAIYVPEDEHFGGPTPAAFFRPEPSLPAHMRYFGGKPPQVVPHGTAWAGIPFISINAVREILPGMRLIPTVSETPGTRELREISLAIDTPDGQILIVGCSHPGVNNILKVATGFGSVRLLVGGFHWVTTPAPELPKMARALRDDFKVASVAAGHCTGEIGFKELQEVFGDHYVYAGVGTVIPLDGH